MNFKNLLTNLNPFKPKIESALAKNPSQLEEVAEEGPIDLAYKAPKKAPLMRGGNWKLSETDKQIIVAMYATGVSTSEIVERMRNEHNVEISQAQILTYSRADKWQPAIRKLREKHMEDISEVAGSHKKVRLQRAETIYDKAIGKNKLDVALKATESQRKEMEEGNVSLTLNQFNILSDDELKSKHEEVLKRIQQLSNKGVIDVLSTNKTETTGS